MPEYDEEINCPNCGNTEGTRVIGEASYIVFCDECNKTVDEG